VPGKREKLQSPKDEEDEQNRGDEVGEQPVKEGVHRDIPRL
jgi:hypothetical protein